MYIYISVCVCASFAVIVERPSRPPPPPPPPPPNHSLFFQIVCSVDYARRSLIAPNHTCTHILNYGLRDVLGDHVSQKGSIVLPERLRFDFAHQKPMTTEELAKVEQIVRGQVGKKPEW